MPTAGSAASRQLGGRAAPAAATATRLARAPMLAAVVLDLLTPVRPGFESVQAAVLAVD